MSISGFRTKINGLTFNVRVEGRGRPVLLLHGFPDSAYLWRRQIAFLAGEGYRVIAPDLRGFGDTDAPRGREHYTLDAIAGDVTALMDRFGIERAPVIGHDWGAALGWNLAINHHERVERYIALSVGHPAAYRSDLRQIFRSWYVLWFQVPFLSELSVRAMDWRLLRALSGHHAELEHWIGDLARSGRLTAGINWYRANFSRQLLDDFPSVKVPVFGIWSSGDIFLSEQQMLKSAAHVDAPWRYERIEGSGHWIPLDVPERLNRLLLEYLRCGISDTGMSA
jgi:pimeloyl-ACP methyl ester carboxylesterase